MDQYPTGNRRNTHSLSYYPNYLANGYPVPGASYFIYKTNTTSFPHNQLEQKQDGNLSRKCLNILIGFLVIWAVVSTVLAIVYGIKYDHNTCMAPSEQSGLNPENPNLLRGSVTIENLMYDDTLKDHSSPLFKFYKDLICNEIVENVKDQVPVEGCDILQMSPGSLSASWVIGPKSANDIELDGVAAKVEDSLNNWMLASKKFQGRIGRVYRDACALMEDNPCQQMCVFDNKKGNMDCACEEGFKLNDDRTTCSDIDECLAASCPDKCINTDGGYKCVCPEGYTQAENGRDCTETIVTTKCDCPIGYENDDDGSCIDTNECETSPCADICVNTNGSYWCSCGPNKVMSADGINCLNASLITTLDYDMEIKVTGSNISLVCMLLVTGPVREVALQWQAPDMKVIQDDINERIFSASHKEAGNLYSDLKIRTALTSDGGIYTCVVTYKDMITIQKSIELVIRDCPNNEFSCENSSLCIRIQSWCDRTVDCYDGSDEVQNCTLFCPDGFTRCNYSMGQCIPTTNVCNARSKYGCDDEEHNRFCSSCHSEILIPCNHTNRCIHVQDKCDRNNNCGDWEDEIDCDCFPLIQCSKTGICIEQRDICDGTNDCMDGEDELRHCGVNCSSWTTIMCNSTSNCINSFKLCDGYNDCGDWEDEKNCGLCTNNTSYREPWIITHFRCGSGECLHYGLLCDSQSDCLDGSDENYCTGGCPQGFMRCNSSSDGRCIPEGYRCDFYFHCNDGEDEDGCGSINPCPAGYVYCNNTHRCIRASYICDGDNDCGDNEDEMNCTSINPCSTGYVYCNNTHRCIRASYICDGDNDCGDYEDEINCKCPDYKFKCARDGSCKYYFDWCDGYEDCRDGSDEYLNCTSYCPNDLFHCANKSGYTCLPPSMVCDGKWHCGDGADEKNCECPSYSAIKCNGTYKCIDDDDICDGRNTCGDLEDEIGCGDCNKTQFKCKGIDVCLNELLWCDGISNCPDGSDEPENCVFCDKLCAPNQIKCDGKCVLGSKICDGVLDCLDYSDENTCVCSESQYKCQIGLCIDKSKLCDRHLDCPDDSDESNCTKPCSDDMFECETGDRCISLSARCDGITNCPDSEDERGCEPCNKDRDWTKLNVSSINNKRELLEIMNTIKAIGPFNATCAMGMCIPAESWCDRVIDCPDASDEASCMPADAEPPVVKQWLVCPQNWFKCFDNKKCIPQKYVCDLLADCDDHSDEGYNCKCPPSEEMLKFLFPNGKVPTIERRVTTTFMLPSTTTSYRKPTYPRISTTAYPTHQIRFSSTTKLPNSMMTSLKWTTSSPHFSTTPMSTPDYATNTSYWRRCKATGFCLWGGFLCDGFSDCLDGSDEDCDDACNSAPSFYSHCLSGQCFPSYKFCDTRPDCVDGSDEDNCKEDTCSGFLCGNGRCIPSIARCDGRRDCTDWTDEMTCSCNITQYVCPLSTVCADKVTWCDGIPHCPNNTDETNCTDAVCYPEQFRCDGKCINKEYLCDGTINCRDLSDELNCDCSFLSFKCSTDLCVSRDKWCDGIVDCPDGKDEPDKCLRTCPAGFHWCEKDHKCVHPFEVCQATSLSLCNLNTTEPPINCSSVIITESMCGLPAITPQDRVPFIFNGIEAKPHSWPWMVELHLHGNFYCGGNIVDPQWILTAAHCLTKSSFPSSYTVIVGSHVRSAYEPYKKKIRVSHIILHEDYQTVNHVNDIGLVRLSEPLTYNRHVQPVCIPKINFPPGRLCTGVGWGTTLGTGNRSVLNQARLPILIQSTCRYWHRETNEVYPSMVCAGYEDGRRGDCHGDSGGPLLCFRAGRFWIQGVTSWGRPECKADEAPTVFTRVPSYYDWITEHISLN